MLSASLVFSVCIVACSMRDGMNDNCEWPSEPAIALDLRNRANERHLVDDLRVAEELGIRYSDSRVARGTAPPEWARTRDDCDTRLFNEIAHTHSISLADVRDARHHLARDWDLAAYLPLVALYAVAALIMARRIRNRFFWPEEKLAVIVATLLASAAISAPLVPLGHLWGGVVEMIRVGDMHMSYRADRLGWRGHDAEVFALGVVLFWSIVLLHHHGRRVRGDGETSTTSTW